MNKVLWSLENMEIHTLVSGNGIDILLLNRNMDHSYNRIMSQDNGFHPRHINVDEREKRYRSQRQPPIGFLFIIGDESTTSMASG